MEIVLLVLVLVTILVTYSKIAAKFDDVSRKLSYLHDLYQNLLKRESSVETIPNDVEEPGTETSPVIVSIEHEPPLAEVPQQDLKEEFTPVIPPQKVLSDINPANEAITPVQPLAEDTIQTGLDQRSWWDKFKERNPDLEKFIGENLINKIGILILVLGISYFVKFAIDKNWISEPARVGIGIFVGGLIMTLAHKLRLNYQAFSSVLVAGAIAVFYLTIAIAFHDYHLFGQEVAFLIMVVITAFSALVCISYNRVELAVLSLIGGFAVPFMVSTGQGSYVILFTYIAILNIGILTIAYFKKWMLINIQAYIFTIILFGAWLIKTLNEPQAPYLGAFLFAFLYYVIFILMNILNSLKNKISFTALQITILISNTFIFYGEGMGIFTSYHPELRGIFTVLLSLLNLICAYAIYIKSRQDKNVIYLLIGLSLSFITLAVPVQFKGNYITLFWAAEAVLLMWLAQRSKVVSFRFGSVIVTALMCGSLFLDWAQLYGGEKILAPLANQAFLSSAFAILSLGFIWKLLKADGDYQDSKFQIVFNARGYRKWVQIILLIIGYLAGFLETYHQAFNYLEGSYAPGSIVVLYHFIFSALLIYGLHTREGFTKSFLLALSLLNVVLFVFVFSNFALSERQLYINLQSDGYLAYVVHFILFIPLAFFSFFIFRNIVNLKINMNIVIWIFTFFAVYFVSAELILHSIFWSVDRVGDNEIVKYLSSNPGATGERLSRAEAISNISFEKLHDAKSFVVKTGFPILWAVMVFVMLLIGVRKKLKHLRIAALVLLGITVIKLFVFDIRNASETGKIVAFILLGVLILIISFVYQKIKKLVVNDEITEGKTSTKDDEI